MSEHEQWFKSLNANGETLYFLGDEHKVSEMAWDFQQAKIDALKIQLNSMEQCYIQMKKERDELQGRLEAVDALSRMRAAVIGSWKREEISIKVRKAISCLADKEKILRGEHE